MSISAQSQSISVKNIVFKGCLPEQDWNQLLLRLEGTEYISWVVNFQVQPILSSWSNHKTTILFMLTNQSFHFRFTSSDSDCRTQKPEKFFIIFNCEKFAKIQTQSRKLRADLTQWGPGSLNHHIYGAIISYTPYKREGDYIHNDTMIRYK